MNFEDWEKAGKIAAQVREYGKSLIIVGSSLLEVTEKIEEKIVELGAKPAFPVDICINEIAAHYSALVKDKTIFKENNFVKIDLGVSVNGAIGDTACTVSLNEDKKLIEASEKALEKAISLIKPGIKLCEIGKLIQTEIESHGFSPIKNLSGHGLDRFKIHTAPNIPNFDNKDGQKLEDNQIIAIEPFATTGVGVVRDFKPSEVFMLTNKKPIRDKFSRELLNFIEQEYSTLPFAKRWLLKKFNPLKVGLALRFLEKENIIHQFKQLIEESKGLVSQAEHTLIVRDKPKILTKSL